MIRANQAQTDPGGVRQRTLEILQQVTGDADVLTDPDLPSCTAPGCSTRSPPSA